MEPEENIVANKKNEESTIKCKMWVAFHSTSISPFIYITNLTFSPTNT